MCLLLYVASPRPLAGTPPSPLQIQLVAPCAAVSLRAVLSQPHLSLVTVDGCSCAFPSRDEPGPVEPFDGMLGDDAQRALGAAHVRALLELVDRAVEPGEHVELFPAWVGDEAAGARGHVETTLAAIDPEHFCFAESHHYVFRA